MASEREAAPRTTPFRASVPAAAPPGGAEALDRLRRFGGDRLLRDMSAIFLADMPARIARAYAGVGARDAGEVAYAAHSMKASSAQFGAAALQRLCADVEKAARLRDLAGVPALLAGVEREFAAYRAWLEREVPLARADRGRE